MASESKLEKRCRMYAELQGFRLVKWIAPGNKGVPDRILLGHKTVVFCEFKAPGKKLRPEQVRWAEFLTTDCDLPCYLIANWEDFANMWKAEVL